MLYLCLIYGESDAMAKMPEADRATVFAEYMQFTRDIKASGHYRGGEALQPVATATTVRSRNGKVTKTDGPFAETREQLGGFYLIDAKDLDEATAIGARIPGAKYGSIEVRPVMATPEV
jgi:hypothetical protein